MFKRHCEKEKLLEGHCRRISLKHQRGESNRGEYNRGKSNPIYTVGCIWGQPMTIKNTKNTASLDLM